MILHGKFDKRKFSLYFSTGIPYQYSIYFMTVTGIILSRRGGALRNDPVLVSDTLGLLLCLETSARTALVQCWGRGSLFILIP